jgi:multiple sugar transport system permease protein
MTGVACLVVAIWLFPVVWMVLTSVKQNIDITSRIPVFTFVPTWDHYRNLFQDYHFGPYFVNSVIVAASTTGLTMLLACPAAYALGCMNFRGSKDIALWTLSQRMLPPIAVVIPFFILLRHANLIDTTLGLILVNLVPSLPFAIWLLRGFFVEVPGEVREAAVMDGLTHRRILAQIVIPIAGPGIAVTALFTFVFTWNEYLFALFLTSERATTVPVGISQLILAYQVLWGEVAAAGTIAVLPLLPVVFYMQRHIVRGMTLGAVK